LMTRRDRLRWLPGIASLGFEESFTRLFGRSVAVNGGMLLRAPQAAVASMVRELALARGLPPVQPSGAEWKCDHVLPPAMRFRLQAHRTGRSRQHAAYPQIFANLRQTARFAAVSSSLPTLLRGSRIYSFEHRRLIVAGEHMEALGYRMFSEPRASFADEMDRLPLSQVKDFAGNGMHAAVVGTILLFLIAGTRSTLKT
jgi:hypothetical protein